MRKLVHLFMSFAMVCTCLYTSEYVYANEAFDVSFTNAYASVNDTISLEITGANPSDCHIQWRIDENVILQNETSFKVQNEHMQELIEVTVQYQNQIQTEQILVSDLPVIYIDIENNQEVIEKDVYLNADIKMSGNKNYPQSVYYEGKTEIKGRGNSTWELPKKPYRLKLDEKASLYGMSANKHWTLIANYLDESLLRNQIAYELSDALGMYSVKSTLVDVVMNGRKAGNYQLCEHIRVDKNRVDVLDYESIAEDIAKAYGNEHGFSKELRKELENKMVQNLNWITTGIFDFYPNDWMLDSHCIKISDYYHFESTDGGYLIELDDTMDELTSFYSSLNQPMMVKSPEYLFTNETMLNDLKNYIHGFESSIQNTNDFTATINDQSYHYSDLYDMDSLLKYFLIQEIFFNYDSMNRSTYMYKDIDSKMVMGPVWDMDYSSGNDQVFEYYDRWETLYFNYDTQTKSWYKYLIKDPYFITLLRQYYWNYRDELEKVIEDGGIIDAYQEYLQYSAAENARIWHDSDSFDRNVSIFKEWLVNRVAWLDLQFETQASIMNSLQFSAYQSMEMDIVKIKDRQSSLVESDDYDRLILYSGYDLQFIMDNALSTYKVYVNQKYLGQCDSVIVLSESELFEAGDECVVTIKNEDGNVCSFYVVKQEEKPDTTIPAAPSNFKDSYVLDTSITFEWDASESDDVVKYVVYNAETNDVYFETSELTYTLNGLTPNRYYCFYLIAVDADGNESQPVSLSTMTDPEHIAPEIVVNVQAHDIDYKSMELTWDKSETATSYDVYVKTDKEGSEFTLKYADLKHNRVIIEGIKTGRKYSYYIIAKNKYGSAEKSEVITFASKLYGEVFLNYESVGSSRYELKWNKIDGATRYIIYRKRNNDSIKRFLTLGGSKLSFVTSELPNGHYEFVVKAGRYDSKDRVMTEGSNKVKFTVAKGRPDVRLSSAKNKVTLNWTDMAGVTHYQIYRKSASADRYTKIAVTKYLTYTTGKLTKGKKYYFKVRGYKKFTSGDKAYNVYTHYSSAKSITVK